MALARFRLSDPLPQRVISREISFRVPALWVVRVSGHRQCGLGCIRRPARSSICGREGHEKKKPSRPRIEGRGRLPCGVWFGKFKPRVPVSCAGPVHGRIRTDLGKRRVQWVLEVDRRGTKPWTVILVAQRWRAWGTLGVLPYQSSGPAPLLPIEVY